MAFIGAKPTNVPLTASDITDGSISVAKLTSALDLSSNTVTLPSGVGGKVLQVVQATDTAETDTTSSSYVTTGLSVNITPSSSSNKVLVIANGVLDNESSGTSPRITLYRGSTNIGSDSGLTRNYTTARLLTPATISKLDSPSSSSQITYSLRLKSSTGATVRFGENIQQVIIAMEIQG